MDPLEFLDAVGTVAGGAEIYQHGVRYVDNVKFWEWLTGTVVKEPVVGGSRLPLDSAEALQTWVRTRLEEGRGHYVQHLLQNRGAEFDFVRSGQNDPVSLLKGDLWRLGTEAEDRQFGIDAVKRNLFTGEVETYQIKAGTSPTFRKTDLSPYMSGERQVDHVVVNKNIADWRRSPEGLEEIARRGDEHPSVRTALSDEEVRNAGKQRFDQALDGKASPTITVDGVLGEIGSGMMVGAVIGVGMSALKNYGAYRRGDISGGEFSNLLVRDSAEGAVTGSAIAAVNIPVQIAAHAIGVGAPVTIPVMIIIGVGLRSFIQPAFGKGEYEVILRNMTCTTDVARGFARFAVQSHRCLEIQRDYVRELSQLGARGHVLNHLSAQSDRAVENMLEEFEK